MNNFFQAVRDLFCEICECCEHMTYFQEHGIDVFVAYASQEYQIDAFLIASDMRWWLKAKCIMDHRSNRSYKAQEKLARKKKALAIVKVGEVLEVINPETWESEQFPTYKVGDDHEDVYDNEPYSPVV